MPKVKRKNVDEEIDEGDQFGNIDDLDLRDHPDSEGSEVEEEDRYETAAEKRLRLAKQYLAQIKGTSEIHQSTTDFVDAEESKTEIPESFDAAEIDKQLISERLKGDVLEQKNRMFYTIADKYADLKFELNGADPARRLFKGGKQAHRLSVTSVAVCCPSFNSYKAKIQQVATPPSSPGRAVERYSASRPPIYLFSASKDGSILQFDFYTGQRVHKYEGGLKRTKKVRQAFHTKTLSHNGHLDQILAISGSPDGLFLATGGRDRVIKIWNIFTHDLYASFKQHRDSITGLAFRKTPQTTHLYSSSNDRTVKVWNVADKAYIETLFGHQDEIGSIDALLRERCLTSGARERTLRLWKIVEESQLVFRGGGTFDEGSTSPENEAKQAALGASVDVSTFVDDEHWISGSDSGALSLWSMHRKKALYVRLRAHKLSNDVESEKCFEIKSPKSPGIVSLSAVKYSDLFASGSWDGNVRLWKIAGDKRSFSPLLEIPAPGFINSLSFFYGPKNGSLFPNTTEPKPSKSVAAPLPHLAQQASSAHTRLDYSLYLLLGIGQEHRLGRWYHVSEAHNGVELINLG